MDARYDDRDASRTDVSPSRRRAQRYALARAMAQGQSFYCKALAGESTYNICINSDLTVSCNCQDFSGLGHIGDLRTQTLGEIMTGATARRFQDELAKRRFPTDVCAVCAELTAVPARRLHAHPAPCAVPTRGIMVENTALCNLRCHLCRREELLATRTQHTMSTEDVELVAQVLREHRIRRVHFYSLGEPFIAKNVTEQVRALRAANPDIQIITSTNALLLDDEEKLQAALEMDYVMVSLDGTDTEIVRMYQSGGDFDRAYGNMHRLVERRAQTDRSLEGSLLPVIEWKYLLFRWNDSADQIAQAIELAERSGVDLIGFYPGAASRKDRSRAHLTDRLLRQRGTREPTRTVVSLRAVPAKLWAP